MRPHPASAQCVAPVAAVRSGVRGGLGRTHGAGSCEHGSGRPAGCRSVGPLGSHRAGLVGQCPDVLARGPVRRTGRARGSAAARQPRRAVHAAAGARAHGRRAVVTGPGERRGAGAGRRAVRDARRAVGGQRDAVGGYGPRTRRYDCRHAHGRSAGRGRRDAGYRRGAGGAEHALRGAGHVPVLPGDCHHGWRDPGAVQGPPRR